MMNADQSREIEIYLSTQELMQMQGLPQRYYYDAEGNVPG
jgi:hypothetical protein